MVDFNLSLNAQKNNKTLKIRILSTTDIHAYLMNFDYYRDEYVDKYGLVGLSGLIEIARAENPNTLLFDNGDLIQGSPLGDYMRDYAFKYGHPAFFLMNELGYDVGTLGNHEFNFGVEFLEKIIPKASFPYICANLVDEKGEPWIDPFVILERSFKLEDGNLHTLNIGVIGVLPPQILKWDKNHFDKYARTYERLYTLDITETVANYIPRLKERGSDLIVVLAHTGYSVEAYCKGAENSAYYITQLEGVDVVIAGHQHGRFPSIDYSDYKEYGFDIERGLINGVPSVMSGSWSRVFGVIDINRVRKEKKMSIVDRFAEIRSIETLPQNYVINPKYIEVLNKAHKVAREKMNIPIGTTDTEFYSYLSLIQDDECIQIVSNAQKSYAFECIKDKPEYQEIPVLSAVPLFKVGSRKDDPTYYTEIPKGELTYKDIADLYVYPNQLVILEITGENLREWLECCVSIYHTIDPHEEEPQELINWNKYRSYNVDIIKGVEYCIDITQEPRYNGDLELINDETFRISALTRKGTPIKDSDRFLLVTNSYRALVDRFPGAGRENAVYISKKEISQLILRYIMLEIEKKDILSVKASQNWEIESKKIENCKLLLETSNSKHVAGYIEKYSQYEMDFSHYDAERFAIYRIDYSKPK